MRRRCGVALVAVALTAGVFPAHGALIQRAYQWEFLDRSWQLTHSFSAEHYRFFRSLPRVTDFNEYASYISDPRDDDQLTSLITEVEEMAYAAGLNYWERLNLIIALVQSFTYVEEDGEYPRYPIETLVEGQGDCEDLAILTVAILQQMGFSSVLLAYTEERHIAVGVRVVLPAGSDAHAYEWNGDAYYYLETTSTGWEIGEIPSVYTSRPLIIGVASSLP